MTGSSLVAHAPGLALSFAEWIGGALAPRPVAVEFAAPLHVDAAAEGKEEAMLRAVAAWFDARVRAEPTLLRSHRVGRGAAAVDDA